MDGALMRKTKTAFLYALPSEIVPKGFHETRTNIYSNTNTMPFIVARHQPNGLIVEALQPIKTWFDEELAAENGKDDLILLDASIALPALSLSPELWADAIKMLTEKLDKLKIDKVQGYLFTPFQLGLNITTKYAISDWYSAISSGFRQGAIVEYKIKRKIVEDEPEKESVKIDAPAGIEKPTRKVSGGMN